jgi:ketosteroid isomerase-like protein
VEIFPEQISLWWNIRPEGQTMSGGDFASAIATGHPPPNMRDYRLEIQTVRLMGDGFVVTLAVRGTSEDGSPVEAHLCQIMTVENDRIARMEEYLDRIQHTPFNG